jgi:hypothetical protein
LGLLSACGPKDTPTTATPSAPPSDAQTDTKDTKSDDASFDPNKGLYLPEATRQGMGIVTALVQKKTFQAEQTIKFQVFREADEQPLPGMSYRSGYAYASTILTGQKTNLALGQEGEVMEKRDPQKTPTATLIQMNALPNSNQSEFLVEIIDPQHQFILAEFCTVRWKSAAVDATTTVPDSALLKTTEGDFVYVQKEDRFVRTEVKLGATGEGFTEITEGVAAGDSVVTNPVQTLWLTELKLKSGGNEP